MAVVQISRIQARRGLQQDLPTLASAELGWSVDQRRLFIGNGTLTEGAPTEGVTEILTQYTDLTTVLRNYTFRGNAGGYTAQTGPSMLSPTVRSFQDKLDDIVNVKDFGATGNGVTDDTAAINRAITQIYYAPHLSDTRVRRTIYFPAGTYNVSGTVLLIPPYARLVGDGIESTVIQQTDGTQPCLMQVTDSLYQTGASMGQNSATLPGYVTIEEMTLANTNDKDIVILDSVLNFTFFAVEFLGSLTNPTTAGSQAYAGVKVKSFARTSENVNFWSCNFKNTRYALLSDDAGSDVKFNGCTFMGLYKGVKLGQNSTPTTMPANYKFVNCVFYSIANTALDCYAGVSGILSSGNNYVDVGNNFAGVGSPVAPVLSFVSDGNYSLCDTFARTDADDLVQKRISYNGSKFVSIQSNVGLVSGNFITGIGGAVTLADNTSSYASTGIVLQSSCQVNYTITRGTAVRHGSFTFTYDGTTPNYSDNYMTSGTNSITLATGTSLGRNVITYISSSTGVDATMKYNINYFN
jgi:hypothetical protein